MNIETSLGNLLNYKKYLAVEKTTEEYLQSKGYLKIELPVLSPALVPESYLEIFQTEFQYFQKKEKLYLTPSPELFLKRLLADGVRDCYYLGKSFRNSEPESTLHSPEFTMLEFYKMHATYLDIADELLKLLRYVAKQITGQEAIIYQGKNISFEKWEKLTVAEAFQRYAGLSPEELFDSHLLTKKTSQKGYRTEGFSYEDLFSQVYVQDVEPNLGKNGFPTLLYDYPKEFAALAQLNQDGQTAQRFEFYIEGVELGDCYSELTDWQEQDTRFKEEVKKREQSGKIRHPVDTGFIDALKKGLEPCAGIAIGFERLAMIFADAGSIDQLKLIQIK
jgi:EF-P lysine aminoacylase GenX